MIARLRRWVREPAQNDDEVCLALLIVAMVVVFALVVVGAIAWAAT